MRSPSDDIYHRQESSQESSRTIDARYYSGMLPHTTFLRQLFEIMSSFFQLQSGGAPFRTNSFFSPRRVLQDYPRFRADP